MRSTFSLVVFALVCLFALVAGFPTATVDGSLPYHLGANNYNLTRPEGVRTWNLWVPTGFNTSADWSLVLALHGLGDDAIDFVSDTNLTALADERGFLLAYPQGSTGLIGTGWNAGTCCVTGVDDVGFIAEIIDLVRSSLPIRNDSIHSLGFSNGGFMTESLGCRNASVFKSIASVSGNTIVEWGATTALTACDALFAGSATSILHVHGTSDPIVPFTGNELFGWADIPSDMAAWAKRNACMRDPITTLNVSTFSNHLWQSCGPLGAYQVELVENAGGDHIWPMEPGVFEVSNYILDFWQRVTPGGIEPTSRDETPEERKERIEEY